MFCYDYESSAVERKARLHRLLLNNADGELTRYVIATRADVPDRVREIARYRETEESTIIQRAVEAGIETLWRDVVISKYVAGEIRDR